ncbi:MAG TPA: PspC domain-containing protein [Candidatus Dormibacteraeota bacterium]|nr:PspC domain-containing protein [Candidatus Dormibacteraeota bacterium]
MQQATPQAFHRGKDRILGGVCSGLAEGFHIDPLWVRIGFVLLAFLQGVGLLIYIVLWLVMPEQVEGKEGSRSGFDSMTDDLRRIGAELKSQFGGSSSAAAAQQTTSSGATTTTSATTDPPARTSAAPAGRQTVVLGVILVVVGLIILAANSGLVQWSIIWPTVLIVLGVFLLARTLDRRR